MGANLFGVILIFAAVRLLQEKGDFGARFIVELLCSFVSRGIKGFVFGHM